MKSKNIIILLIILTVLTGGIIMSASYNSKEEVVNNIQITISSDRNLYRQDETIDIDVTLKNLSRDKVVLLVVPSFEISSEELKYGIWTPIKFSNNNQNLKANEKDRLELLPKEKRKFKYSLRKLKWDRKISSFWPSKELDKFINKGVYTIVFILQGTIDNRSAILSSNFITIKVK
jgi:hypothetical protein